MMVDSSSAALGCAKGGLEVSDQIVGILESDRQAQGSFADAGGREGVGIHPEMGRGGGMDDERTRVAHIGQMREQPQRLDETPAGRTIARSLTGNQGSRSGTRAHNGRRLTAAAAITPYTGRAIIGSGGVTSR